MLQYPIAMGMLTPSCKEHGHAAGQSIPPTQTDPSGPQHAKAAAGLLNSPGSPLTPPITSGMSAYSMVSIQTQIIN